MRKTLRRKKKFSMVMKKPILTGFTIEDDIILLLTDNYIKNLKPEQNRT